MFSKGTVVNNWENAATPSSELSIEGRYVKIERMRKGNLPQIYQAIQTEKIPETDWYYLPHGPFNSDAEFLQWACDTSFFLDPLFFVLYSRSSGRICGYCSYLNINPKVGSIEIGFIHIFPNYQKSRESTEAIYLLIREAFKMKYRRCEWKCNSLNVRSLHAAGRFGFSFEGLFRQAAVIKGRNRDTAWFSIIDKEWAKIDVCYKQWLDGSNFDTAGVQKKSLGSMTKNLTGINDSLMKTLSSRGRTIQNS